MARCSDLACLRLCHHRQIHIPVEPLLGKRVPTCRAIDGIPTTMSDTLRLREAVLEWREIEGEIVAVDTRTDTYVAVNRTGAALWPALVRGATLDDLASILVDEFKVDGARAKADVDAFIGALAEQRLLEN